MRLLRCLRPWLPVGLLALPASAAEVEQLETGHQAGEYTLTMTVTLAAAAGPVRAVLTDFEGLVAVNPAIIVSEVLPAEDPDVERVRTVIRRCVLIFCPELERVEDVLVMPDGSLEAVIVPELSDFSSGQASWQFEDLDAATRIVYRARFTPRFRVPPLIGPAIVRAALRDEARILFDNVERDARAGTLPTHDE